MYYIITTKGDRQIHKNKRKRYMRPVQIQNISYNIFIIIAAVAYVRAKYTSFSYAFAPLNDEYRETKRN